MVELIGQSAGLEKYNEALEGLLNIYLDVSADNKKWANAAIEVLSENNIVAGESEGEEMDPALSPDEKNERIARWFLGQTRKAAEKKNFETFEHLTYPGASRYAVEDFYGKDLQAIFDDVKVQNGRLLKDFREAHPPRVGWINPVKEPHINLFSRFSPGFFFVQKGVAGRKAAFVIKGKHPDLDNKIVEGVVLSNIKNGADALFWVRKQDGQEVELNINNVLESRVIDTSDPSYQELWKKLKKENYREAVWPITKNIIPEGSSVAWLKPNDQTHTWVLVKAKTKGGALRIHAGGKAQFKVRTDGKEETWNLNTVREDGSRFFVQNLPPTDPSRR